MHKKLISTLAMGFILASISNVNANTKNITDISEHWANKEIQEFVNNGYINGYPEDNTFRPDNNMSRAEFIKVINKYFGFTAKSSESFSDVNSSDWYYNDICIAINEGFIGGYPDNTFRPNQPITREEVAKIIITLINKKDDTYDKLNKFTDCDYVSNWAKPFVEGAIEEGIIKGDNGFIHPRNSIKRGEAVTMLSRVENAVTPEINNAPVISSVDNLELTVGDTYNNSMLNASATDKEDGTLTVSFEGTVDTSKEGVYTVIVKATDSKGLTTTKNINVIVNAKVETPNNAPTLSVTNVAINIKEVYSNDMLNATATDIDGDEVTLTYEGNVDTNKVGTYTVKVIATDAKGAKTEQNATVKVNAVKPIVNGNNVTITEGDAFNNAMVGANATDCEGKAINVDITGTVNSNVPGSYKLILTATDEWGLVSTKEVTVTVEARVVAGITNPNSSEFKAMVANEMYALVNAHRVANGQSEFVTLNRLEGAANAWSKHMADTGIFDHVINGESVEEKFPEFGEIDGENIAATTISGSNFTEIEAKALANELFTMWKNSAGHNNTMLDVWLKSIGFGFYAKETSPGVYRIYATQEFYGLTTRSEEPIIEEQPQVEEKVEEPIIEEQPQVGEKVEEPVVEEKVEEPVVEEKVEEPIIEEQPQVEEPVVEEQPQVEEIIEQPVVNEIQE